LPPPGRPPGCALAFLPDPSRPEPMAHRLQMAPGDVHGEVHADGARIRRAHGLLSGVRVGLHAHRGVLQSGLARLRPGLRVPARPLVGQLHAQRPQGLPRLRLVQVRLAQPRRQQAGPERQPHQLGHADHRGGRRVPGPHEERHAALLSIPALPEHPRCAQFTTPRLCRTYVHAAAAESRTVPIS
jgi:hypothetical protein